MKKVILLGIMLLLMTGTSIASAAPSTYRVLINGYVVTGDTLTESNTTLVPFKVIFDELEYKIVYTAKTKTIQADKTGISISLTIGSTKAFVNGKVTEMLVAPKIVNGVTYVPLRFIASVSGEDVSVDNGRHAIQIGKQIEWTQLDQHSFRNAKWGMSLNQVKNSEKSVLLSENNDKMLELIYQSDIAGFDSIAAYFFPNNTLGHAGYFVELSGKDSYVEDYKTLTDYLTKKYGMPTFETIKTYREGGIEHTDIEWTQLILKGEVGLVAKWKTVDSDIMLVESSRYKRYPNWLY